MPASFAELQTPTETRSRDKSCGRIYTHWPIGSARPAPITAKESAMVRSLLGDCGAHGCGNYPACGVVRISQLEGSFCGRSGWRSLPAGGLDGISRKRAAPQAAANAGPGPRGHDGPHGDSASCGIGGFFLGRPPSRCGLSILPCWVLPGNADCGDISLCASVRA